MARGKVQVHLWREAAPGERDYAVFHRCPAKGDYWQPITGNVDDDETIEQCALREAREEAGVAASPADLSPALWTSQFTKNGVDYAESVFGLHCAQASLRISSEHRTYEWLRYSQARERLQFDGNRRGLEEVERWIASRG